MALTSVRCNCLFIRTSRTALRTHVVVNDVVTGELRDAGQHQHVFRTMPKGQLWDHGLDRQRTAIGGTPPLQRTLEIALQVFVNLDRPATSPFVPTLNTTVFSSILPKAEKASFGEGFCALEAFMLVAQPCTASTPTATRTNPTNFFMATSLGICKGGDPNLHKMEYKMVTQCGHHTVKSRAQRLAWCLLSRYSECLKNDLSTESRQSRTSSGHLDK